MEDELYNFCVYPMFMGCEKVKKFIRIARDLDTKLQFSINNHEKKSQESTLLSQGDHHEPSN